MTDQKAYSTSATYSPTLPFAQQGGGAFPVLTLFLNPDVQRPLTESRTMTPVTGDRVAPGRYLPGAPTDPYVLALEHTVPQITGSLRVDRASASCVRGPMGNAGGGH